MPLFKRKSEKSIEIPRKENASIPLNEQSSLLLKEEQNYDPDYPLRTESRLSSSSSLPRLFSDPEALAHFIQFLEKEGGQHNLVRFCLEVESMATASPLFRRNGLTLQGLGKLTSSPPDLLPTSHSSPSSTDSSSHNAKSLIGDMLNLYRKYIKPDSPHCIKLPADIVNKLEDDLLNTSNSHTTTHEIYLPALSWVLRKLEEDCLPRYLQSSFYYKHQVEILTSGKLYLADIIFHDTSLFYFMEFMEQVKGRHLVDFLLMANSYRVNRLENLEDTQVALDDAIVIYEKFFSLQASSPLGLSDRLRLEIEGNICQEDQPPSANCFLKPAKIVTKYLEKNYLPQFLQSHLFSNYLSECLALVQNGSSPFRKRSGSESSSSEHSFGYTSTTNTLLAMESNTKRIFKDACNMRIENDKFTPESLWRRNLAGKLQITTIDKYGKVKSEFQPEPDRRSPVSLLSKAVRKLVTREDEEKVQEEMAWEAARGIVQDICNLTMGKENS